MNILSQSWWIDVVERICNKLELTPMQFGIIMQNPKVLEELEAIFRKYSKADEIVAEAIVAVIKEEKKVNLILPPKGFPYTGPKPIERQVEILAEKFRKIDPEPTFRYIRDVLSTQRLQDNTEGRFAVLSENAIGQKYFSDIENLNERYCKGVRFLLDKMPDLNNFRKEQINSNHLRRSERTKDAFQKIAEIQNLEILIISAQTGFLYQNNTVIETRNLMRSMEFGLGMNEVLSIGFTHPERITEGSLSLDCVGDEFSVGEIFGWKIYVLSLTSFNGGTIMSHETGNDNKDNKNHGGATGFLPAGVEM
ncbi:MAG: hypothetical protein WC697_03480 [Patescibacteria group bacterium]